MSVWKLKLVSITYLGERKVPIDFVNGLLDEGGAFLAHDVEEVEFEMAFVCLFNFVNEVSLDELADPFKFA